MGTPVAVPLASPKLVRMSLRTIPLSVSTFGPFVPSPGNGPPVSSGIAVVAPAAPLVVDDDPPAEDDVVAEDDEDESEEPLAPHAAATVTTLMPARNFSA